MTQINKNQLLHRVGIPTPQTVIYKSESHKLHQAFPAKKEGEKAVEIVPGQAVKLNTDGTIEPYVGDGVYLGIAVTYSRIPAYPEGAVGPEVTVMVEAFAVVYGVASGTVACGYVEPEAKAEDDLYVPYKAGNDTKFVNITPEAEAGELIQILIR